MRGQAIQSVPTESGHSFLDSALESTPELLRRFSPAIDLFFRHANVVVIASESVGIR